MGEPRSFSVEDEGFVWPIRRSTRPALDVLQRDQRRLIYGGEPSRDPPLESLTDGFRSRRSLINWYQAAVVRTFGHICDEWPPGQLDRDAAHVNALVGANDADDEWLQTRTVEALALPACRTAYRGLRVTAGERMSQENSGKDDWKSIDVGKEEHVAMRPGFSRLDAQQGRVLAELWGGFESRSQVSEWLHSLHPPTHGELSAAYADDVLTDQHALAQFLGDSTGAKRWREAYAIHELLPRFADATRHLRAGEESSPESQTEWRKA